VETAAREQREEGAADLSIQEHETQAEEAEERGGGTRRVRWR